MNIVRHLNKTQQGLLVCLLFPLLITTGYTLEITRKGQSLTDGLSLSVGLEFDSGNYGTEDTTETWRVPFGLEFRKGQYFTGFTIPYISSESTGTLTVSGTSGSGMRSRNTSTSSTTVSKASGMGDLNVYAGYNFLPDDGGNTVYHVTARVKLGTADEDKGLGTGENDYAVEAGTLTRMVNSNVFASIGYQFTGDSSTTDYDNVLYVRLGASISKPERRQLGAILDYTQAATPGFDDSIELTGFMNIILPDKNNLYFYVLGGLSDSSPDYGAGVNYRVDY